VVRAGDGLPTGQLLFRGARLRNPVLPDDKAVVDAAARPEPDDALTSGLTEKTVYGWPPARLR